MTVRETLGAADRQLTPAERKVVRELLANYPMAGLGPASRLASRAGVSDPTITRLVVKLGFAGYADFQNALVAEIEHRDQSPLSMFDDRHSKLAAGDPVADFTAAAILAIDALSRETLKSDLERAVDLMADPKRRIFCVGGRFSGFLAGMLRAHLVQLRTGTLLVGADPNELADIAADLGPGDVLVAFDYRRYQRSTVDLARHAAGQGAVVVLFTDRWRSPLARLADTVLTARVEAPSPFDTLVPALTQLELVVALLTQRMAETARTRIERVDRFRRLNRVTLEPEEFGDNAPGAAQQAHASSWRKPQ